MVAPEHGLLPRRFRLAYFVSHPIQYQAPLLREIAAQPDIELKVFFTSDFSVRGYHDAGFGTTVNWDIPLLEGYQYEFLPKGLFANAHYTRQASSGIFRRLYEGRFDAVWIHGYNTPNSLQALMAARLFGISTLLRSDSNLYDRPRSAMKLRVKSVFLTCLRGTVSAVLACGKANREYWQHYFGGEFPIFDMPYAVDNDFFRRCAEAAGRERESLRRELDLTPGRPVVLFASKLQPRKRCMDLVEAFLEACRTTDESLLPYLLIVGEGEERAIIEARVKDRKNIRMLGFRNQSELPRFFNLCDVFVLPSVHEPWGLVVNEAMNAGRAVIVSDEVGCQRDLVHDGVNGFVFQARSVASLAAALTKAFESPERLRSMGEESLRIVQDYGFAEDIAALRAALAAIVPAETRQKRYAR